MIVYYANRFAGAIAHYDGEKAGQNFIDELHAGIKNTATLTVMATVASSDDATKSCGYLNSYKTTIHDIENINISPLFLTCMRNIVLGVDDLIG